MLGTTIQTRIYNKCTVCGVKLLTSKKNKCEKCEVNVMRCENNESVECKTDNETSILNKSEIYCEIKEEEANKEGIEKPTIERKLNKWKKQRICRKTKNERSMRILTMNANRLIYDDEIKVNDVAEKCQEYQIDVVLLQETNYR